MTEKKESAYPLYDDDDYDDEEDPDCKYWKRSE
jgi:hypothetical protein